jgi:hypothetical protein
MGEETDKETGQLSNAKIDTSGGSLDKIKRRLSKMMIENNATLMDHL